MSFQTRFLHNIIFIMSKVLSYREDIEVMAKLEEIAGFAVKKTGIFHNQPSYYKNKMKKPSKIAEGLDKQVEDAFIFLTEIN